MTPKGCMCVQFKMLLVWASMQDSARVVKTAPQKGEKENADDYETDLSIYI